jgi:hypothetical protein
MITITWMCTGVAYNEKGDCCDNCGHAIKTVYYAKSSTGETRKFGSECILTLGDPSQKTQIEKTEKRIKTAAAQWRKQTPAPLANETRESYIQRRFIEMGNAWNGYKMFLATPRKEWAYEWTARHQRVLNRLLRINGVVTPDAKNYSVHSEFANARHKIEHEICERQNKRVHARIERLTGANRFDYWRASWEVKKI